MNDNALIAAIINVLAPGLAGQGATVGIKAAYPNVQVGVPSAPTIFLSIGNPNRYGSPQRKNVFDPDTNIMTHTETVWYETMFQVSALATENPDTPTQLTAGDYLKAASKVLQSDDAIAALQVNEIGIYRIQKMRQIWFKNDSERFQASPSFDFTVTHKDVFTTVVNSTKTVIPNLVGIHVDNINGV